MTYCKTQIEEASVRFLRKQTCSTCPISERCKRHRYCMAAFREAVIAGVIDLEGNLIKRDGVEQ